MRTIKLLSEFDPIMNNLLNDEKKKIKYLSWQVQNEIIEILATSTQRLLCKEIQNAQCFSIIMDSTQDINKIDQVSVVIRYVVLDYELRTLKIEESFMGFFAIDQHGAKNYEKLLTDVLLKLELDVKKCKGQGYDGAAVMSGIYSGVQKRIRDIVPNAFYVHCCSHNLNLVISDAVKTTEKALHFFNTVQAIFVFFSSSAPRWSTLAFAEDVSSKIKQKVLKKVCPTRWESRHESIYALKVRFKDVLKSLSNISLTSQKKEERSASLSLKKKMESMEFVFLLCLWENILKPLHGISKSMQKKNTNLFNACKNLEEATNFITRLRCDYENVLLTTKNLCKSWDIPTNYRTERTRFAIKHFDEIDGDRRLNITEENLKIKLFLPIIDTVLFQINSRFEGLKKVNDHFHFLHPSILVSSKEEEIVKASYDFVQLYHDDISPDFTRQLLSIKELFANISGIKYIKDLAIFILENDFSTTYSDVLSACLIYLTLPVTVASAERSFSKLKLIKNYLRNSIGQDRLSNISILNIEKEKTADLDINKIINDFAVIKTRKINFYT